MGTDYVGLLGQGGDLDFPFEMRAIAGFIKEDWLDLTSRDHPGCNVETRWKQARVGAGRPGKK